MKGDEAETTGQTVHDMEAAACYEAGNFYYGPHQMIFLKVVTDHGIEKERLQNDSSQGKDITNYEKHDKQRSDNQSDGIRA